MIEIIISVNEENDGRHLRHVGPVYGVNIFHTVRNNEMEGAEPN